jgi:hypothetical protein
MVEAGSMRRNANMNNILADNLFERFTGADGIILKMVME